jgi:hypothetical protein
VVAVVLQVMAAQLEQLAAAASSFSSIQNQLRQLQMPQTLGCLELLAPGLHQQAYQMLTI